MSRPQVHRWQWVLIGMSLILSTLAGCTSGTAGDKARRLNSIVWVGAPANPPQINDDLWKDLSAGDTVKTDDNGQAELQLAGCSGSLYVFKDTKIGVHACLKEESGSGTFVCSKEGTAWFNQVCPKYYCVDSAAGRVTITGTTFSVTYRSDLRLMLVIVLDGRVAVQPVVDFDAGELDPQAIPVEAGWFVYVQDPDRPQIPGAPAPNVPLPIDQLPPLFDILGIAPWVDDLALRAQGDGITLPSNWSAQPVTIALLSGGPAFDDPNVQEAALAAIDKDAVLAAAFPGQNVTLLSKVGRAEIDARTIAYDPDTAIRMLAGAKVGRGFTVELVYPREESEFRILANELSQYLGKVGIAVKVISTPGVDVGNKVSTEINAGVDVMWLERR